MSLSDIQIGTADYRAILSHLKDCANQFNPPLYSYIDIEEYSYKIFQKAITFEGWNEGKLIGLIAAYYNDYVTKTGYITNVSVIKEFQGLGIASRLLQRTLTYGRQNVFSKVVLEVRKENLKVLSLYEKQGFVLTDEKPMSFILTCKLLPMVEKKW